MANKRASNSPLSIDSNWQAQSDMSTLLEAKKIYKDPKRMKAVQELAKSKLADIASLSSGDDLDGDKD